MSKKFFAGIFIGLVGLLLATVVVAQSTEHRDLTIVAQDEILEGPQFFTGENVIILGTINGDAYVAGGLVTVDGIINGDLLVLGGEVTVNGSVARDVRAAGGNVGFNGEILGNLTVIGGNIKMNPRSVVGEGVVAVGGNLNMLGEVGGKSFATGGVVDLAGRSSGDVNVTAGNFSLNKSALIDGNLTYRVDPSGDIQVSAEATVSGTITKEELPFSRKEFVEVSRFATGFGLAGKMIFFIGALMTGLLIVRFAPRLLDRANDLIEHKSMRALGVGSLSLLLIPIVAFVLIITVIGAPLGVLVLVSYFMALYITKFLFGYWIGSTVTKGLTKKDGNAYGNMITGLAILTIVSIIPFIGALAALATAMFGLGAVMIMKWEYLKTAK